MTLILKIVVVAFLAVASIACVDVELPPVKTNTNDAVASAIPTETPFQYPSGIYEDADGNSINPKGWEIQEIVSETTSKSTATGKTKKGKAVTYNILTITPANYVASTVEGYENPYSEWRIRSVDELSGADGKVFCYAYRASLYGKKLDPNSNANTAMASSTSYQLCDFNGDGKYEVKRWVKPQIVPNWVKSLPGDPATIQSNANRQPDCGILCSK